MIYKSTRGAAGCSGMNAVLKGLADDGGLYAVTGTELPKIDVRKCLRGDYYSMAEAIVSALLPDFEDMGTLLRKSYSGKFDSKELTPLVPLGEDWVLELFHGPTSAFKDMALSVLPLLISSARLHEGINGDTVILTATSGDTGKAALEGFHDVPGTRIFVFYPAGGVSPIQEKQMVSQQGANVCVCAVRGNFDDCQSAVKFAFGEINSKKLLAGSGLSLSSANSINIGRLVPQVVYYFSAYAQLMQRGAISYGDLVDFVVPTGNFGDILAGYYAKLMGLPVGTLVCASNANRVLTDFFSTGCYDRRREFIKSSSPSMDILISSNLERLIYLSSGGDAALVKNAMEGLNSDGLYTLPDAVMARIRESFAAYCCDEEQTAEAIRRVWQQRGYLCDPHTAVALKAADDYKAVRSNSRPVVTLSTASPYKFPAAVLSALGEPLCGDEFSQLRALNALSGMPIPTNLAMLEGAETLHHDEIARQDILPYILSKLEVKP